MTVRLRFGLSSRLAFIVALGLITIQVLVLTVAIHQTRQPADSWRHPFLVRLASIVEAVENTPADRQDLILDSVSNPEAAFSFSPHPIPPGYELDQTLQIPDPRTGNSGLVMERRISMLVRRSALPALWVAPPGSVANRAVTVELTSGGYLLAEPVGPRRRRDALTMILIANLLIGIVVVTAVWLTARRLISPFEVIAARARTFASHPSEPPMREDRGPPEARDMAEAFNVLRADVDRLLGARMRMLAAVAHDLRTYLTRLQLRLSGLTDADQREAADNTVRRMSALIDDVLLAARAEQAPMRLEPTDLSAVLEDIVKTRRMLGQSVDMGDQPSRWIHSQPFALSRALENLVDNAVRHGGSCQITIQRAPASLEVYIIDHGPGLSPEIADRAFEPFVSVDQARNKDEGGVGLGLYIARTLLDRLGGRLLLRDTEGGGLTCVVGLDLSEQGKQGSTDL